mmetsp:Transcript_322/g.561  ORF Transcript_322/g.561 Transcript_322/m.561 type:complete len:603 (+) Transcript_322:83-1891(+)
MLSSRLGRCAANGPFRATQASCATSLCRGNRFHHRSLVSSLSSQASDSQDFIYSFSFKATIAAGLLLAASYGTKTHFEYQTLLEEAPSDSQNDETTVLLNWSGTHAVSVHNDSFWEPETIEELEAIVKKCHENRRPVRPLGSALSPNGLAFHPGGMVSLTNLDKIINVDKENMTVTVQAGARVSQVVDALRPYGLTLPNLASIAEQQMGGFIQVGAHGTGARIAPVDHYVTKLKLVTPAKGTIELTEADGEQFQMAKVGLGCLGVVAEVTMKVIPAHKLVEHTFVLTRKEATAQLDSLLKSHKHVRYMWIPYQDAVVVVTNDPEEDVSSDTPKQSVAMDKKEQFRPLTSLLASLTKDSAQPFTDETMEGMGFGELRDALLAVNPLDVEHVRRCNEAEAEFWSKSGGYQIKSSDELLQFDCGGQQWVWEVCFPTGKYEKNNGNDMIFMQTLLQRIEDYGIPAHSPIEQRWTAASSSLMSPAHGKDDEIFSWVGIIMYLPSDDEFQRREITERFTGEYCSLLKDVGLPIKAASHWAKLERPHTAWQALDTHLFLKSKYPLAQFNDLRWQWDPDNILTSPNMTLVLGKPKKESRAEKILDKIGGK